MPQDNKSEKKGKKAIIIILCIILLVETIFFVQKMGEFAEAYQKCEDDFEVINECQCFPEEGNYTYLKNKLKSPFYNNGE